jgi:hypothetical protein
MTLPAPDSFARDADETAIFFIIPSVILNCFAKNLKSTVLLSNGTLLRKYFFRLHVLNQRSAPRLYLKVYFFMAYKYQVC